MDPSEALKMKRRKTRVELDREKKRIRRLINIRTEDMKFYRPPPNEEFGSSLNTLGSMGFINQKRPTIMKGWFAPRDKHLIEQEELEVKNAKYLLIRMRNEETNLRKSAFEREKKGFDELLFEEDSEQHRITLLREQQKLKRNIEAMNTQYKQQLDYRDTHLQEIIEGDFE